MNSPGIRPRNNKPAAKPESKAGSQQKLRVLSADGTARAEPSIAMPRAKTELSELLANDGLLCVRRRASAIPARQNAEAQAGASDPYAELQAESSPAPVIDAELAHVIDAWPSLPRNVRAAVLAMIRETAT